MTTTKSPEVEESTFVVVGIGAAADDLESLKELFSHVPAKTGLAYVIIQSLSKAPTISLSERLASITNLPVIVAEDGMQVEPDHIYLLPTDQEMVISNYRLLTADSSEDVGMSHAASPFFLSLSVCCGHRGIAVILSGLEMEDLSGAQAVHEAGGLVITQGKRTCRSTDTLRSVMTTRQGDLNLPPSQMAESMIRYSSTASKRRRMEIEQLGTNESKLSDILLLLKNRFDLDFSLYKPSTITRRVDRRLVRRPTNSLQDYHDTLLTDDDELQALYSDLLIGVTRFFRDEQYFEVLTESLPLIFKSFESEPEIRVWVAGCATGQEAYTMSMIMEEYTRENDIEKRWKVFATDIHQQSISKASTGLFDYREMEGLSPVRKQRHFNMTHDGRYEIKPEIRKSIVFSTHNIVKDPPFTNIHLVSCRNLLIYLNQTAQHQVLSLLSFALRCHGFLFLGPSESTHSLSSEYSVINSSAKIYQKMSERLHQPILTQRHHTLAHSPLRSPDSPIVANKAKKAIEILLQEYVPSSVLVDLDANILHIFGSANRFLSIPTGEPRLNLTAMVGHPGRALIKQMIVSAKGSAQPIAAQKLTGMPGHDFVDVVVKPLPIQQGDTPYFLISFKDSAASEDNQESEPVYTTTMGNAELADQVLKLEEELLYTKESLQATVEAVETINEELGATNEELIASNEELHSTNEELQSVNEELYAINTEFRSKENERVELESDERNILESAGCAILILDSDLKVRKFSPLAEPLFNLLQGDEGRPFTALSIPNREEILAMVRGASEYNHVFEKEITDVSGSSYAIRIYPYSKAMTPPSKDPKNSKVVISLVDITSAKHVEDRLIEAEKRYQVVLDAVSDGYFDWKQDTDQLYLSGPLCRQLGYPEGAQLKWQDLLRSDADQFMKAITKANSRFRFPTQLFTINNEPVWLLCKGETADKRVRGIFISIEELKQRELQLEESKGELIRSNQLLEDFAFIVSHDLKAPIRHILYYLEYLREAWENKDSKQVDQEITAIHNCASRLARLIDDITKLARLSSEPPKAENVDLNKLLDTVLQTFNTEIKQKSLEIVNSQLPTIQGDFALLEHLFQNLITNAYKYNDKENPTLSINYEDMGESVKITFKDNGIGLSDHQKELIFLPFKRVASDTSIEGAGIGLTICKTVVEHHKGTIEASGEEGKGCVFTVTLPKRGGHE